MMNVKTLANMLNPRCGKYDELDAVQFIKDPNIADITKLEAIFGKRWVYVQKDEYERLLDDPALFIKQWFEIEAFPRSYFEKNKNLKGINNE